MANYEPDSKEYQILKYRTQCFQNGQQNEIDKAKGIVTEPLPKSWWVPKENIVRDDDSPEEIERKNLYMKLCASKQPYFFGYVYPSKKAEYNKYVKAAQSNSLAIYQKTIEEMIEQYEDGTLVNEDEIKFIQNYLYYLPLDLSKSTMNRICWCVEREFNGANLFQDVVFDYSILKSENEYDQKTYDTIKYIIQKYKPSESLAKKRAALAVEETESDWCDIDTLLQKIIEEVSNECNNSEELCDILIDLCYGERMYKQILWTACGETIFNRLLNKHNNTILYPQRDDNGDFWCQGVKYSMVNMVWKEGEIYED